MIQREFGAVKQRPQQVGQTFLQFRSGRIVRNEVVQQFPLRRPRLARQRRQVEHFKPLLIGQEAGRIEHLWQVLFRGGFFPAGLNGGIR